MMTSMIVTDVRPWGGPAVDVRIEDGRIAEIRAHRPDGGTDTGVDTDTDTGTEQVLPGRGRLALPTFADVHVHLDSTRLGLPFRPHTGGPGVWTMMQNDRRHWREAEVSITERVATTIEMMIERGTTRMRSYAQVDSDAGLERFEAVLAGREGCAGRAEIEVVAFPQAGLLLEDGSIAVLEEALRAGADVVGGIDPCSLDRDPARHLAVVFDLAEKYRTPVDIHLHEPGELGAFSIDLILDQTRARGMQGQVTIAHAFALGQLDPVRRAALIEQLVELDIAITTVAPSGPGTLPLTELLDAGVRVGLGEDGQRDYWSPYGNADMLDRTWQLAFTQRYRDDAAIERCLQVATVGGRAVLNRSAERLPTATPDPGATTLAVGDVADLVLIEAETPTSAVMDRPGARAVLHQGRLVAGE